MNKKEFFRRIAIARDHDDEDMLLEKCVYLDLLNPQGAPHLRAALDMPGERRVDWVEWRLDVLNSRNDRKQQTDEARRLGVGRFLPDGRYDLDALTQPERERKKALWDAAGRGLPVKREQFETGPSLAENLQQETT